LSLDAILTQASQRLAEGASEECLRLLLEAWRLLPAEPLAGLIEKVSAIAEAVRPAPEAKKVKEKAAAALQLLDTGDPTDYMRALRFLGSVPMGDAQRIVEVLRNQPRDPRLLGVVVGLLEDPPWSSTSSHKLWRALLEVQAQQNDPRAPVRLTCIDFQPILLADWAVEAMSGIVRRAAAKMVTTAPTLSADLTALCGQIEQALERRTSTGESLLGELLARPHDDRLRAVYSDWLTERGDPRGEFIALQLARAAGELDASGYRREAELFDRHWMEWLGSLAPLVERKEHVRFEKGFPAALRVDPLRAVPLAAEPGWATVHSLMFTRRGEALPVELMHSPAMKGLRSLFSIDAPQLEGLIAEASSLPLECISFFPGAAEYDPLEAEVICNLPGFPRLKELGLDTHYMSSHVPSLAWSPRFWSSATAARIERVRCDSQLRSVPGWLSSQAPIPPHIRSLEISEDYGWHGWTVELTRGTDGRFSRVEARVRAPGKLDALFEHVFDELAPDALEHFGLTVDGVRAPPAMLDRIAAAASNQTRLQTLKLPGRELTEASRVPKGAAPLKVKERRAQERRETAQGSFSAYLTAADELDRALGRAVPELHALSLENAATLDAVTALLAALPAPEPAWTEVCFRLLGLEDVEPRDSAMRRAQTKLRMQALRVLGAAKPAGGAARLIALLETPRGPEKEVLSAMLCDGDFTPHLFGTPVRGLGLFPAAELPVLFDWFERRGRKGPSASRTYYAVAGIAVSAGDRFTLEELRTRLASGRKLNAYQRYAYEEAVKGLQACLSGDAQ